MYTPTQCHCGRAACVYVYKKRHWHCSSGAIPSASVQLYRLHLVNYFVCLDNYVFMCVIIMFCAFILSRCFLFFCFLFFILVTVMLFFVIPFFVLFFIFGLFIAIVLFLCFLILMTSYYSPQVYQRCFSIYFSKYSSPSL